MTILMKVLKCRRGQAVVEFALVLPVLLLLLLGIFDFGRIYNEYLVLTAAAREGARSAAVLQSDATVINVVRQVAASYHTEVNPVLVNVSPPVRTSGEQATVTVSHNISVFTPVLQERFGSPEFAITANSVMRVE